MRRRMCGLLCALCLLLIGGCKDTVNVVGTWTSEDPNGYAFRLTQDGHAVMLDAEGQWLSDGTYTFDGSYLFFETDTGNFVWTYTEQGMAFQTGEHTVYYRLNN